MFTTDAAAGMRCGIETDDGIADASAVAALAGLEEQAARTTRAVLELSDDDRAALHRTAKQQTAALRERGALHDAAHVRLGPPVPDPQKIVCLGLNYRDHAAEAGLDAPTVPMFFAKYPNSLAGPTDDIVLPPPTTGRRLRGRARGRDRPPRAQRRRRRRACATSPA